MKLAAVFSELPKHPSRKLFDDQVYVLYDDRNKMEKEFKNPKAWGSWAHYEFKADFRRPAEYALFRERYESLCAGHLKYYDDIVRNRAVDHVMGFLWSDFTEKDQYRVQVFLSPPPMRPIAKTHNNNLKRAFGETTEMEATVADSPAEEDAVDPPKPPPPPPPSMY